ncbi:MAG TPA: tRNA pseudouridine(55) synthase TruB [Candidatus Aminicenantes bacterium]|nr:tRNA pseudouridine(55) synthase TruB [Candidatus Aminicenantes bacterium]
MPRDGLLVIDKPAGPTSHDVVQRVRKALATRRAGHGGTLDPDATGVLLVAVGRATRFFPFLAGDARSYDGRIRLGLATDTYDASGRPLGEECRDWPGRDRLAEAMRAFEGPLLQTPPRFSAKKVGGRPGHERARAGEDFTFGPAPVTVARFALRAYEPPIVEFELDCSAGTYARSLAHDLGRRLGCGAHIETLRRTAAGPYGLADAVPLAVLEADAARGRAEGRILPVEALLADAPAAVVLPAAEGKVGHGAVLGPDDLAGPVAPADAPLVRLFSSSGRLLALARPAAGRPGLHPFLVLA